MTSDIKIYLPGHIERSRISSASGMRNIHSKANVDITIPATCPIE